MSKYGEQGRSDYKTKNRKYNPWKDGGLMRSEKYDENEQPDDLTFPIKEEKPNTETEK